MSFLYFFFKDCWRHSHSSTSLITKDFHVFLAVSLNSPRFAAICSKLTKSWPKPSLVGLWFLNTFLIIFGSWSVQTRMLVEYTNIFQQQSDGVKKTHLIWVAFEPWLEHSSTCLCNDHFNNGTWQNVISVAGFHNCWMCDMVLHF